ncbi:MAG: DoxX-like family protein [Verrucomicrobiota bacterium]
MRGFVSWRSAFPGLLIGGVWIFHGLWSKVLGRIPRHEMIVGRILGESVAAPATILIGLGEIGLGIWVISGRHRRACAALQTLALVSMNTLEILLARDLLISAPGMVVLNLCFVILIWRWALARGEIGDGGRMGA